MHQECVLGVDGIKAPPLQSRGLGVPNGVLYRALAVGVTHACWVGHHTIVFQGGGVYRVELGLIEVGLEHTFLEIVQDHVLWTTAKVAKRALVQLGPDLLAGLPDHATETGPRVAQRGHKQARLAVTLAAGHQGRCALAVVHLHLLAREEAQPVELLRLLAA